jgi:heterodisulfide reductase subunit B
MCHLNLEIRCSLKTQLPIFHFSEILSIALGMGVKKSWLKRHLVDPLPLLKAKGFLERTAAGWSRSQAFIGFAGVPQRLPLNPF